MSNDNYWNKSYKLYVHSSAEDIWQAFIDTSSWKHWNCGVKSISLEGPFLTGTWFSMELPEGAIIRSQLIDVSEQKHFIDETRISETLVRVEHRIEALGKDYCQLTYAISVQGPDAQALGEDISSDFPDVMAGLAKYLA